MRWFGVDWFKRFFWIGGIVLIVLLLRTTGVLSPIHSTSFRVLQPVYAAFYGAGSFLRSFFLSSSDLEQALKENERLREENIGLKLLTTQLQAAADENLALRKLLDFFDDQEKQVPHAMARVTGRDPENHSVLILNAGKRNGVEVGSAVIVADGIMVAKITEVFATAAKALLLNDNQSFVAVTISGGPPASKLARGERGLSLLLDQVPQQEIITKGQLVVTSGLEPRIPAGLLVGEIEEVVSEKNDLFQTAVLKPLVDFRSIHLVAIVISPNVQ